MASLSRNLSSTVILKGLESKALKKYHIASYAYDLDEIIKNIFMAREETGKDTTVIIDSISPLVVTLGLVPAYIFLQRLFAIGNREECQSYYTIAQRHAQGRS